MPSRRGNTGRDRRVSDRPTTQISVVGQVQTDPLRAEVATLECVLRDHTGGITVAFLGRRQIAGIEPGALLQVTGRVVVRRDRVEIINPDYKFLRPVAP
jgi:DNA/RNA endonuclease YhcR with UshA esterase domain